MTKLLTNRNLKSKKRFMKKGGIRKKKIFFLRQSNKQIYQFKPKNATLFGNP